MKVCLFVCLSVCLFTMHGHMRAPILTKLDTGKLWAPGQVFSASGVPQVRVQGRGGQK